jgi:hypothetical protein
MAGTGSRTLKLSILADVADLKKGLTQAGDDTESFGKKVGDFGAKAGAAFAVAGAAALAYAGKALVEATKNAIADEEAQKNLALTLQNTTAATDAQIAAVESYITQVSLSKGITDDELRPAFERLTRSTKDTEETQKLLNIALDVSTATGKPLETVANALGKAYDGNAASLGKLGLGLDSAILKSGDMDAITTALAENFGGFATQRAETFSGKMDRLKIAFDEGKETIGGFVLDGITPLVTLIVEKVVPTVANLSDKIGTGLAPVFKSLATFFTETLVPAFTSFYNYVNEFIVPILKATLTPVVSGLGAVFKKLKEFVEDNSAVFTFFGAVMGVIGEAAKLLAPIIGATLGAAFKVVSIIIDGVSLAIAGVVAGINLAIDAVNLLIKGYNIVNNLKPGSKDLKEIPDLVLGKGAKATKVTPSSAADIKADIAKQLGSVTKSIAIETAEITKTAVKASADTAKKVIPDNLETGLGGTTGNIGEAAFLIRQRESGNTPPVINVNVSGAIDSEGTARTIVDTLNKSFFRGTNGANQLLFG